MHTTTCPKSFIDATSEAVACTCGAEPIDESFSTLAADSEPAAHVDVDAAKALEMEKTVQSLRNQNDFFRTRASSAEEELERLKPELERLRLEHEPPSDEKAAGIRRHAFEALERFFENLATVRRGAMRGYVPSPEAKTLIDAASALMFLDDASRANIDAIQPTIDAWYELDELGWIDRRYSHNDVDEFLALVIVLRCVGLSKKPKEKAF